MDLTQDAEVGDRLGRQVTRLALGFFIDVAQIQSKQLGLDLGQALAFLTIKWANVEALSASSEPRHPITVFAVARRLNLPYETARRHVGALIDADLCRRETGGVQVREDIYSLPDAVAALDQIAEVTRQYVRALAEAGLPMPKEQIAESFDPRRRTPQKAIHHFLEMAQIIHDVLKVDTIGALLFAAVNKANTWHLTSDPEAALTYGAVDRLPPDELRRPITVYALAKQLALPYDTASRHAKKLLKAGLVTQDDRGALIVPTAALASPAMIAAVVRVGGEVDRFLHALARVQPLPY